MANIKLTVTDTITDYKSIVFRAPANSEDCTGLLINDEVYEFLDSSANPVIGVSGFFSSGAILSTTIDCTNHKLYLHNTSNLYLMSSTCTQLSIPENSTLDYALCNMQVASRIEMSELVSGLVVNRGKLPISSHTRSVCYGDGKFVSLVQGGTTVVYSTDGITWTRVGNAMPSSIDWSSVCYGNDKFVAVADNSSNMAYSTDGINWTKGTMPASARWRSVCYGNNMFVAVATSSNTMAYSTDGITWTQGTMPGDSTITWYSLCYGNNMFVAIAIDSSTMAYSTDGINWTEGTMPSSEKWISTCYGNGKFVAVSGNMITSSSTMAYSTDGINWTKGTMPASTTWFCVGYGNGMFVAIAGKSTTMAYSTDGLNWNSGTMPGDNTTQWFAVCYDNGMFVAIASSSSTTACMTMNHSLTLESVELGSQILSRAPGSMTQLSINSDTYDIVDTSNTTVTISKDSLSLLTLDPTNKKAYV